MYLSTSNLFRLYQGLAAETKSKFRDFLQFSYPGSTKLPELLTEIENWPAEKPPAIPEGFSKKSLTLIKDCLLQFLAWREMQLVPGMEEAYKFRVLRKELVYWSTQLETSVQQILDQAGTSPESMAVRKFIRDEHAHYIGTTEHRGKKMKLGQADRELISRRIYCLETIIYWCEEASLNLVRKSDKSPSFNREHIEALIRDTAPDWPLLTFLLKIWKAMTTGNLLPGLTERFREFESDVAPDLARFIWSLVLNLHTTHINTGRSDLEEPTFRHLTDGMKKGYAYHSNGGQYPQAFKNLMELGVRLGHLEEIESRLEEDGPKLPKGILHLCWARFQFEKGEYETAKQHIFQARSSEAIKDPFLLYSLDFIEAKTLYESGESEPLERLLGALKMRLRQHQHTPAEHKSSFEKRLKFFLRLQNARNGKGMQIERLVGELENTQVDDQNWLLEKAKEMRGAK